MTHDVLELVKRFATMSDAELAEVREVVAKSVPNLWVPTPGPQDQALECLADELLFGGEAGGGKALDVNTPIPTPTGWTTMGELQPGDDVFDEAGVPCRVVAKSGILREPTYRLTFSDGAEIVAGERHQWVSLVYNCRGRGRQTVTTGEIASSLMTGKHRTHAVPVAGGIDLRYIVGCERADEVDLQCIQVSSRSRTYLCGRAMIPTHNSDLICGASLTQHERSLILRRFTDDAKELAERVMTIAGTRQGYNGQDKIFRNFGVNIDFGGCKEETDKQRYKGKPHDLIGFDELSDFLESQYRFIITWNRSINPKQRCRVIGATNPPTTPEGLWIIKYWAAWLDPNHPNPAREGELRWYTSIERDGHYFDTEVDGPGPYLINGSWEFARSRSFIRSQLSDNPDLTQTTHYASLLSALPGELRAAYKEGRFDAGLKDTPNQVFPAGWVRAAQARWLSHPPTGIPMCSIGVDVAQGGDDETALAARHDGWFAKLQVVPGKETPDGPSVAGRIIMARQHNAHVTIDMGGGYGGSAYDHLTGTIDRQFLHAYKGANRSVKRTVDKQLLFFNTRAEAAWSLREALDPGQYQGSPIAFPNDPLLFADLTSLTWDAVRVRDGMGVKLIPKDQLVKKLGRSTNRGDAVIMSWWRGPRAATHINEWRVDQRVGNIPRRRNKGGVNLGPRRKRR
jgi:hypothetical protein